ncbi:uncharacterized protein [Argopecten irradians]|uniref:uncharacterized protein n=1 Tax=Argopecten irradians TaxID=31199 RepID=UPI0037202401
MRRTRLMKVKVAACSLTVIAIVQFLEWTFSRPNITLPTASSPQIIHEISNTEGDTNLPKFNISSLAEFDEHKRKEIEEYVTNNKPIKFDEMPWSTPFDLDLRVIVITFDRADSVGRLLESLNNADYLGDKVGIDVWIDRSDSGDINDEVFAVAREFRFKHGEVYIHNQTRHVGRTGQWMNTWVPCPPCKEIAVILQDELTVSKYFYKWLKNVHAKYDSLQYINGYSLQGYSIKHGGTSGRLRGPEDSIVFMYPIIGTMGFSPSKENWIKFIHWYERTTKIPSFLPIIPGILQTVWYKQSIKQGTTDKMWYIWHIYHSWKMNQRSMYPNLPGSVGLTVKWDENDDTEMDNKYCSLLGAWEPRFDDLPDEPIHLNVKGQISSRYQYL